MPIHDWSLTDSGIFHDLHLMWIAFLRKALNEGVLPNPYYALAEPVIGEAIPDVLTLQAWTPPGEGDPALGARSDANESAVSVAPSPVLVQEMGQADPYLLHTRHILIRDQLRNDRVVAVIEIVSRANKASRPECDKFVTKSLNLFGKGIHLVFIDLQPATPVAREGLHAKICEAYGEAPPEPPRDRTLQAVSYQVLENARVRAHVVPLKVGDGLPEMPVFLLPHRFVRLPLEETYTTAFESLPKKFREALGGA
jgi:hypothetical protein